MFEFTVLAIVDNDVGEETPVRMAANFPLVEVNTILLIVTAPATNPQLDAGNPTVPSIATHL